MTLKNNPYDEMVRDKSKRVAKQRLETALMSYYEWRNDGQLTAQDIVNLAEQALAIADEVFDRYLEIVSK